MTCARLSLSVFPAAVAVVGALAMGTATASAAPLGAYSHTFSSYGCTVNVSLRYEPGGQISATANTDTRTQTCAAGTKLDFVVLLNGPNGTYDRLDSQTIVIGSTPDVYSVPTLHFQDTRADRSNVCIYATPWNNNGNGAGYLRVYEDGTTAAS